MATSDTCVSIVPYFEVSDGNLPAFKALCEQFVERTSTEEGCLYYGFCFSNNLAHCREGYKNAEALLAHLANVGALIEEALKIASIARLEVHGAGNELEKLKGPLAELNPEYFELEYGFRR